MRRSPSLFLVDPRSRHRAAVRRRLLSCALGIAVATASAVPFLLTLR